MKRSIRKLLIAIAMISGMTAPAMSDPVSVIGTLDQRDQAGLSYTVASKQFATFAGSPISISLAPGIVTGFNEGFAVRENVGAYLNVGPLEVGATKEFNRGFGLGSPFRASIGFNLGK